MSHATTGVSARLAARLDREARVLTRRLRGAREGDAEGVHQARVASRRLREMIALAGVAAPDEARAAARQVRRVGRLLGPVREIDVSRAIWEAHAKSGDWPPAVVGALERQAAREREDLARAIHDERLQDASGALRQRLNRLAALAADRGDERALRAVLASRVERRAGDLLSATARAGTMYAAVPLHDVRIAAKKFRYAIELVRDLAGGRPGAFLRTLKRHQELLGRLHDLQVIQARLQALAGVRGTSRAAIRSFKHVAMALEGECRALHAEFVGDVAGLTRAVTGARAHAAVTLTMPGPHRLTPAAAGSAARRVSRRSS